MICYWGTHHFSCKMALDYLRHWLIIKLISINTRMQLCIVFNVFVIDSTWHILAREAEGQLAYVLLLLLSVSFSFFSFNDCLSQRDLRTYQTHLHQILCGCRCLIWYLFHHCWRDFAMATNFRRQIGRNRRHAFLLAICIPQRMAGWQSGWTH